MHTILKLLGLFFSSYCRRSYTKFYSFPYTNYKSFDIIEVIESGEFNAVADLIVLKQFGCVAFQPLWATSGKFVGWVLCVSAAAPNSIWLLLHSLQPVLFPWNSRRTQKYAEYWLIREWNLKNSIPYCEMLCFSFLGMFRIHLVVSSPLNVLYHIPIWQIQFGQCSYKVHVKRKITVYQMDQLYKCTSQNKQNFFICWNKRKSIKSTANWLHLKQWDFLGLVLRWA